MSHDWTTVMWPGSFLANADTCSCTTGDMLTHKMNRTRPKPSKGIRTAMGRGIFQVSSLSTKGWSK